MGAFNGFQQWNKQVFGGSLRRSHKVAPLLVPRPRLPSSDLPPSAPTSFPLSLLSQPRTLLSLSPTPQSLPASPLRSPQPLAPGSGPARPRPRREDSAHHRSSNRLSSWCPESAPFCLPPVPPVRPSVRPASRPRLRSASDPGGKGGGPPARSARPLLGSPIAAQPGHRSSQSACAGMARNSAGGKGSPERQPRAPWACTKVRNKGVGGSCPGTVPLVPAGRKVCKLHSSISVLGSCLEI